MNELKTFDINYVLKGIFAAVNYKPRKNSKRISAYSRSHAMLHFIAQMHNDFYSLDCIEDINIKELK